MRARYLLGYAACFFLSATILTAARDTRLVEAVKNHDQKTANALLERSAHVDVNVADAEGMTALLWAAHSDDLEMVKCLISAGADVKATNRFGGTALHEAATFGDAPMLEALLKAGADPNAVRGEGDTALMVAARSGGADAVKVLVEHGATVDATDGWFGETPLMMAVAENYADVAKILIDHGANVNAASTAFPFKRRPIIDATFAINPSMGGLSPLHFAARQDAIESAKLLIAAGADLNRTEPDSHYTPLLTAIINNHYDIATLLIEQGAKVNDGSLPAVAQMRNHPAVVDPGDGHYTLAPPPGSLELMKLIIQHGADVNATFGKRLPYYRVNTPRDGTALFIAAQYVDVPAMQLLLDSGAKPIPLRNGTTPLMAVADFDSADRATPDDVYLAAVKLCLAAGDQVGAANAGGNTALHYAAGAGNDAIVQYLADHGGNLGAKTKMGRTPIEWAEGLHPSGYYGDREQEGLPHRNNTIAVIQKLTNKTSASAQ